MFECDIAQSRSVSIPCMLYKIRCNPVHPLNGARPGPYTLVTRGAMVAHRFTYRTSVLVAHRTSAAPRCRTSQYRRTFIALSVSLWNDLANPVFDGVGLAGFFYRFFLFLLSVYRLVLWDGVFGLIGCISLSLSLALPTFFNNTNNITCVFRSRICSTVLVLTLWTRH